MDLTCFQGFNETQPLVQRLVLHLRKLISEGSLPPGSQLPNEISLAKQFNVSRSTIRASLQALERAGFILRKRGIGTFVSDEPLQTNNLSLNWGVTQVIQSIGASPGTSEISVGVEPSDEQIAKRLNIKIKSDILKIERVRTADLRNVVYTVDYIPEKITDILLEEFTLEQIKAQLIEIQSLYHLFEKSLLDPVHHARAYISPLTADSVVAEKLNIPVGSGILHLEQVDYTEDDEPIWLAHEFHVANAFTFSVYRSMY